MDEPIENLHANLYRKRKAAHDAKMKKLREKDGGGLKNEIVRNAQKGEALDDRLEAVAEMQKEANEKNQETIRILENRRNDIEFQKGILNMEQALYLGHAEALKKAAKTLKKSADSDAATQVLTQLGLEWERENVKLEGSVEELSDKYNVDGKAAQEKLLKLGKTHVTKAEVLADTAKTLDSEKMQTQLGIVADEYVEKSNAIDDESLEKLELSLNDIESELEDLKKSPALTGAASKKETPKMRSERIKEMLKKYRIRETAYIEALMVSHGVEKKNFKNPDFIKHYRKLWSAKHMPKTIGKVNSVTQGTMFERRKRFSLNAEDLKVTSEDGLAFTVDAFIKLGIPQDTVMWMANELTYAFEGVHKDSRFAKDSTLIKKFQNPSAHLEELRQYNESFVVAYGFFESTKKSVAEMQGWSRAEQENHLKKDEEPVSTYIIDKAKEVGSNLVTAFEERDYSQIALYGIVAFGIYKVYKNHIKGKTDSGFGKFLTYGAAAYAGMAILAPETLKGFLGKGVNVDIKGTMIEDLMGMSAEAYGKGLDAGTIAATSKGKISDLFSRTTPGGMNYDKEASDLGMVRLTHPGIRGLFPEKLMRLGNISPATLASLPPGAMTTYQKLYYDASKKLYESMHSLRKAYDDKILPETNVSFEDMFLNVGSPHYKEGYTMASLYVMLKSHVGSEPAFYDSALPDAAHDDLMAGNTGKVWIDKAGLTSLAPSERPGFVSARVYDYPVDVKMEKIGNTDKYRYTFYLVGDGRSTAICKYTAGTDPAGAMRKLKKAVSGKVEEVTAHHEKSKDYKLEYKDGHWGVAVTIKAEGGLKSRATRYTLVADSSGGFAVARGGKVFDVISGQLSQDENAVIADIFGYKEDGSSKNNFGPLSVVRRQIDLVSKTPKGNDLIYNFVLNGSHKFSVIWNDAEKIYKLHNTNEKDLLNNQTFQSEYANAYLKNPGVRGVFTEMSQIIEDMDEKYLGALIPGLASVWNGAALSTPGTGSVRDNYTQMFISSKEALLRSVLENTIGDSESFEALLTELPKVNYRLSRMKSALALAKENSDKELDPNDYESMVMNPIFRAGILSESYYRSVLKFEEELIRPLKIGDVFDDDAKKGLQLLSVYFHYTAHLDDENLDKRYKAGTNDARFRNRREQYFKYVRKTMRGNVKAFLTGGRSVNASPHSWEIEKYDDWKDSPDAIIEPIDLNINLAPYTATQAKKAIHQRASEFVRSTYRNEPFYHVAKEIVKQFATNKKIKKWDQLAGQLTTDSYSHRRDWQDQEIDEYVTIRLKKLVDTYIDQAKRKKWKKGDFIDKTRYWLDKNIW
ncbi:hypothetical protein HOE67_02190 [Candidatus Peregrinibacteria bacterium]|nr:hypothetical protein [Candidatus Peregrinibacteria bacterium]